MAFTVRIIVRMTHRDLPQYYPRAQFTGTLTWSCPWCGKINKDRVQPGTTRIRCGQCERQIFYGLAMHLPAGSTTKTPKDCIVPRWAGDDTYPFDTIQSSVIESIPPAFFDPTRKVAERGRVHVLLLHDSIYLVKD